jgi:hypothetical protein
VAPVGPHEIKRHHRGPPALTESTRGGRLLLGHADAIAIFASVLRLSSAEIGLEWRRKLSGAAP